MTKSRFELHRGDAIEVMSELPDSSVDMVMVDPPYGTTRCKWDVVIPLEPMWRELRRVCKPNAAMVVMAAQPFTSVLVTSNLKEFRYSWVWDKVTARGHLVAKKRPMAQHEDLCVFYRKAPTYNPQMTKRDKPVRGTEGKRTEIMGGQSKGFTKIYTHKYPKTILTRKPAKPNGFPTQKPVPLMTYMIRTYSNPDDVVLDFALGSGSTGVAAIEEGRRFIGIEKIAATYKFACDRIERATGAEL